MRETGFSRVSKNLIITEIEKELKSRPIIFVARHHAVPAASLDQLRSKLRGSQSRYLVVKNSLARIALDRSKLKGFDDALATECGFVFTSGDPVFSSKILTGFAKENEGFKIQKGFINGEWVSLEQIKILASLPPREVLIARVVGGIQAPLSRFVCVLSGTLRKMVTVLDAIAKKKQP